MPASRDRPGPWNHVQAHEATVLRGVQTVTDRAGRSSDLYGTLNYKGNGNVLDQILISPGLLTGASGLRVLETTARLEAFPEMTSERRTEGPVRFGLPRGDAMKNVNPDGFADHIPVSVMFA